MYDHLLNEPFNRQRHEDMIREAEAFRRAKAAQIRTHSVSHRIAAPVRRTAHLVAAHVR